MSMNMNREQKRQMRKMGAINENDAPVRVDRQAPAARVREERTPPRQFIREVRGELRNVAWPSKEEVKNYSIIVLATVDPTDEPRAEDVSPLVARVWWPWPLMTGR